MKIAVARMGWVASFALLAGCGGGSGEPAADKPAEPAATTAAAPAADPAAGAPAADNTDTLDGTTLATMTGDAAKGEKIFLQCKTCHVLDPGVNRIGPSLAGIVGSAAGAVAGYKYSDANKNSGITWSREKLYQFLEKPQRVIPGTKMAYAGLPSGQDRADVIAYLETAGK